MKDRLKAKDMSLQVWEKLRRHAGVKQDDVIRDKKMRLTDRHLIQTQKAKEIKGKSGAYEQWMDKHERIKRKGNAGDRFDFVIEDVRANPDSLREDEAIYANSQPNRAQLLMGSAVEHLQGRQREVYILTMREGLSIAEAAKKLSIAKGTAQGYRDKAIKFITDYCQRVQANESEDLF